jgi:hypothetical protein
MPRSSKLSLPSRFSDQITVHFAPMHTICSAYLMLLMALIIKYIAEHNYRLYGHYPSSSFLLNFSETGLCLRPQVKAYSAGPN